MIPLSQPAKEPDSVLALFFVCLAISFVAACCIENPLGEKLVNDSYLTTTLG